MTRSSDPAVAQGVKRKLEHERAISPPSLRRKVVSGTTQTAVASFFTPTSQKLPEKVTWTERGVGDGPRTLLVGRYVPAEKEGESAKEEAKRRKVAAFDFVSSHSEVYVVGI
jgi:bifunctional polynucleotide phosphatase/kinase